MQFTLNAILAIVTLSLSAAAQSVSVSYDTTYDDAGASLDTVACSDGANGLITKGYSTFGSLPVFPNIGGAPAVGGWNSAACGSCWQITYDGKSINVLAIDVGRDGFNLSEEAMNELTNNQAVQLGRVNAEATQVAASVCGLA
ncbi:immunomodulatory protein [Cytidiella melzeri]|nr:immunomodulatory protein [Cytidiella melzeri]